MSEQKAAEPGTGEPLPTLIERRLKELSLPSLKHAYDCAASGVPAANRVSYETVRRLWRGEQRLTRSSDTIRTVAAMIRVPTSTVRDALRTEPHHKEWKLPPRANALTIKQRKLIEHLIDEMISRNRH